MQPVLVGKPHGSMDLMHLFCNDPFRLANPAIIRTEPGGYRLEPATLILPQGKVEERPVDAADTAASAAPLGEEG